MLEICATAIEAMYQGLTGSGTREDDSNHHRSTTKPSVNFIHIASIFGWPKTMQGVRRSRTSRERTADLLTELGTDIVDLVSSC